MKRTFTFRATGVLLLMALIAMVDKHGASIGIASWIRLTAIVTIGYCSASIIFSKDNLK